MTRLRCFGLISLLGLAILGPGVLPTAEAAGKQKPSAAKAPPPAPMVKQPIKVQPEGFQLGLSAADVGIFYDKIIDLDYRPEFKKTSDGSPEMRHLEAKVVDDKAAFRRTWIDFGELPTGIDNTPLRGEFNYKNNEAMMWITRGRASRFFFFSYKKLSKVYDVILLAEGGEYGVNYKDAVSKLSQRFGVAGRFVPADPAVGRSFNETDWMDANLRARAIDRSDENVLGLVIEDRKMADASFAFRAAHKDDQGGIDPLIQAVTKQGPAVDPNAKAADAYTGRAHAEPAAPAAPPPHR